MADAIQPPAMALTRGGPGAYSGLGQDDIRVFGRSAYRNARPGLFGGSVFARPSTESNRESISRERNTAVANAREVDRNNAFMQSGIDKRALNLVGTALKLRALPNYEFLSRVDSRMDETWADEFKEAWENVFSQFTDDVRFLGDAHRHLQFGGQMELGTRMVAGPEGEVGYHIRYDEERAADLGALFATFVEVVDTTRISTPRNKGLRDGPRLQNGRQLDRYGAATGFWIESEFSDRGTPKDWSFVPRETGRGRPVFIHYFKKKHPDAQRGMPAILAALADAGMTDVMDEKTLEAAAAAALLSVFVKSDSNSSEVLKRLSQTAPEGGFDSIEQVWDYKLNWYSEHELGAQGSRIPVLPDGDEIMVKSAQGINSSYGDFIYHFARKMAAITGVSTAHFTGDYSKTSFASIRAEFMDAWREVHATRYQLTQATATPIAACVMEEALALRMLPMPANAPDFYRYMTAYTQCEWRGLSMGTIDPVKDPTGAGISIMAGSSNPEDEAAVRGGDVYDNIKATARVQKAAKKAGVELRWGNANAPGGQSTEPAGRAGGGDAAGDDDSQGSTEGEEETTDE